MVPGDLDPSRCENIGKVRSSQVGVTKDVFGERFATNLYDQFILLTIERDGRFFFTTAVNAAQWHMPTPYGDANLPTKIAYGFAEDIKAGTDGDIAITVHSGASLVKHPEIPRAVRTGQVQLGEIFIGIMGNTHPVFKHDNIPFLATSFEDAKRLWEAAKPEVEKQLDKEGMKLLYTVPWPAQSLYTKAPVNTMSDLEGLKMRAYSPSTSRLADLMNTTPTTVQVPEIPQAFSTGIIDAMITSPSTGANGQACCESNPTAAAVPRRTPPTVRRAAFLVQRLPMGFESHFRRASFSDNDDARPCDIHGRR